MVIFLYGKDNYSSLQKLKSIKKIFLKQKKGQIIEIEATDFKLGKFKNHINTQALFAKEKLIILKYFLIEAKKTDLDQLQYLLGSNIVNTTLVFYERDIIDKRSSLFKKLIELSKMNGKQYYPEFQLPKPYKLRTWIKEQAQLKGVSFAPPALDFVLRSCQNWWQANNQLQKLVCLGKANIKLEQVKKIISPRIDDNIFNLTNALSCKDLAKSCKLVKDQLHSGAQPLYLLAMISRQIKILIKIKSFQQKNGQFNYQQIAKAVSEHPFAVKKSLSFCNLFSLTDLIKIQNLILKTEILLKSTNLNPESLLIKLLCDII